MKTIFFVALDFFLFMTALMNFDQRMQFLPLNRSEPHRISVVLSFVHFFLFVVCSFLRSSSDRFRVSVGSLSVLTSFFHNSFINPSSTPRSRIFFTEKRKWAANRRSKRLLRQHLRLRLRP